MGKQIMDHHKHWHAVTVASPTIGICNQSSRRRSRSWSNCSTHCRQVNGRRK